MTKKFYFAPLILAALGFSGCGGPSYNVVGTESHFAVPNSNVVPLGPVHVKTSGTSFSLFQYASPGTGDNDRKVYNLALQKVPGATAVVDWTKAYRARWIGLGMPLISWTELEFEGTAVKANTGMQELH